MSENMLPIVGPKSDTAAMTTMATSTKMSAYSNRPCPVSFLNNTTTTSLLQNIVDSL